jgi:hypothetical protein
LDELEANRRSRRTAWATLQRLRKFLEANGTKINIPDDRNFETEGDASESGLRRLSVILTRLVADRKVGAWAARSHAEQPTSVRHLLSERSSQILPSTDWARIEYQLAISVMDFDNPLLTGLGISIDFLVVSLLDELVSIVV